MPIGISKLARSIRQNTSSEAIPVSLGHAHQLVAAAMGYRTLASCQAAQETGQEPLALDHVLHVVIDNALLRSRAQELGVPIKPAHIRHQLNAAFSEHLPFTELHETYEDLEEVFLEQVKQFAIDNDVVDNAMAGTINDGIELVHIDAVRCDFKLALDEVAIGNPLIVNLLGYIDVGVETELPYTGYKLYFEGTFTLKRFGLRCFGEPDVDVTDAALGNPRRPPSLESDDDGDIEEEPSVRSLSQAYADLLGLETWEVDSLLDIEPQARTDNSGDMVYGYLLDFESHATPEVAIKIRMLHGSLQFEVGPDFFESIRGSD